MINYDEIERTLNKYPMCVDSLAELRKTGHVSNQQHAVCAVGAMLRDVGVPAEELVGSDTDDMINKHFPKLRKRYGFARKEQVLAFVEMNDLGSVYDANTDKMLMPPKALRRKYTRGLETPETVRARLLWYVDRLRGRLRS